MKNAPGVCCDWQFVQGRTVARVKGVLVGGCFDYEGDGESCTDEGEGEGCQTEVFPDVVGAGESHRFVSMLIFVFVWSIKRRRRRHRRRRPQLNGVVRMQVAHREAHVSRSNRLKQ